MDQQPRQQILSPTSTRAQDLPGSECFAVLYELWAIGLRKAQGFCSYVLLRSIRQESICVYCLVGSNALTCIQFTPKIPNPKQGKKPRDENGRLKTHLEQPRSVTSSLYMLFKLEGTFSPRGTEKHSPMACNTPHTNNHQMKNVRRHIC